MKDLYNANFSHIYVEEQVLEDETTKRVLSHFKDASVIIIKHYKDVFNRPHQDYINQKKSQSLILAKNNGTLVFEGSPVCQDFGYDRFFYTASAMNCMFDCDYCFLKGMYSTSNIVLFVNFEDYKNKILEMLKVAPVYLCISYDTDLAALNGISGLLDKWIEFAKETPDLVIETRTKSAPLSFTNSPNIVYAYTLSPEEVIEQFEHGTASLDRRIDSINRAIDSGANVRLCFDPMIYIEDYEVCYNKLCDEVINRIDFNRIKDVSIGTFRISKDYIKSLRKTTPCSAATNYPFVNNDGYCSYKDELSLKMINLIKSRLTEVFDENRVFCN